MTKRWVQKNNKRKKENNKEKTTEKITKNIYLYKRKTKKFFRKYNRKET